MDYAAGNSMVALHSVKICKDVHIESRHYNKYK